MRRILCVAINLGIVIMAVLFAASCSKKVAKTNVEPADTPAQTAEQEVQKMPDESAGDDTRLMAQLRTEAAAREAAEKAFVNENVHFALDSALLSDRARQALKNKADYLSTNPEIVITIEGHCDERGTNAYNNALGERRAESVKIFLVDLGIDTDRMSTVSFGEKRPIAIGHNETSWAMNRRAQFVIN